MSGNQFNFLWLLLLLLSIGIVTVAGQAQPCWVQEIHYHNPLIARNEFVEIACRTDVDTTGWTVQLYRQLGGRMYQSYSMDELAVTSTGQGINLYVLERNRIADGAIFIGDANQDPVEFISFEGTFLALGGLGSGLQPTDIGVSERSLLQSRASRSLQLQGTGCSREEYTWGEDPVEATMGAINTNQVLTCTLAPSFIPTSPPTKSPAPSLPPSAAPTACEDRCYASCVDAALTTCGTESGLYQICPDGPLPNVNSTVVYCDQETAGGGWMLLYSYKHLNGTNDPLVPGVPPTNETDDYSHFYINEIPGYTVNDIEAVRFYCETTAHRRKVHFVNRHPIVKQIAFSSDQTNNDPSIWSDLDVTTFLPEHTAFLPRATVDVDNNIDGGFDRFPFWAADLYHWGIRGGGTRWECDDTQGSSRQTTRHLVWARTFGQLASRVPSAAPSPCEEKVCYFSCNDAFDSPCAVTGIIEICPQGIFGPKTRVYCDQDPLYGGGWMLTYSYDHRANDNFELVPGVIPLNPITGYSHFFVNQIPGYREEDILSLRFYCTTSGHFRQIHFETDSTTLRELAWNGDQSLNSPQEWIDTFIPLGNHNANLPAQTDAADQFPDGGLDRFPFFKFDRFHWSIRGSGIRWECDDFVENGRSTHHQVWVRLTTRPTTPP